MSLSNEQRDFIKKLKRQKIIIFLVQLLIIGLFLGVWELLSRKQIINSFIFSSPSSCIKTLKLLIKNGDLLSHINTTLIELFISFGLGLVLGLVIALILYSFPLLNKVLEPFLTMLNSLPKVALGPMLIIWFGANIRTIIVMALLINLIVSIVTILNGFYNIDKVKLKLLKSFKANKIQILKYLILPGSLPTIMSAVKLNISMSLIGVVMGEFLVSRKGIGYLIIYGTQIFNLDLVISGVLLLVIISFILYKLIVYIESKVIKKQ